jgi:hypothetical protein
MLPLTQRGERRSSTSKVEPKRCNSSHATGIAGPVLPLTEAHNERVLLDTGQAKKEAFNGLESAHGMLQCFFCFWQLIQPRIEGISSSLLMTDEIKYYTITFIINYNTNKVILLPNNHDMQTYNSLGVIFCGNFTTPSLWSSGESFWLQIQRSWVRYPALPDFLRSSGSGTESTQPREDNWGATWKK